MQMEKLIFKVIPILHTIEVFY
ncbi:Protein of unknown function [Bacillus wiedmannii]|uniref:Uncharacterized protein n=1 Tax=Bacillus wiedmannii TaxID=1890302 RepID=A0AB37YQD9_9BACI|nr:Protein of unknown function [Bacillus wiedmannii]